MTAAAKIVPGTRYGRLTVLADGGRVDKTRMVLVRCDCGNEKTMRLHNVLNGNTLSCGCGRMSHLAPIVIGARYGKLTILADAGRVHGAFRAVSVQCDCGKKAVLRLSNILIGNTLSCGCSRKETRKNIGHKFSGTVVSHCAKLGISRATFYNRLRKPTK